MNIELIREKLDCAIHRAALRGLRHTIHAWQTRSRNGKWALDSNTYMLPDLIIEGSADILIGRYKALTKKLGIKLESAEAFVYGLTGGLGNRYASEESNALYQLGREYRGKL